MHLHFHEMYSTFYTTKIHTVNFEGINYAPSGTISPHNVYVVVVVYQLAKKHIIAAPHM